MAFVSLDTEFAQALLKGLDAIDEVNILDLRQDPELHALLCDLVGRLATQLQPGKSRHRPINVEDLLAEKYLVWDDPTDGPNRRRARQVLSDRLAIHGRSEDTFSADSPTSAATSFLWALDDHIAVKRRQLQLNTMSDSALDDLTLADLAHSLCIAHD